MPPTYFISGGKTLDIFLKKKSDQLPKKSKRKELLNHLNLVAKLEAEVRKAGKSGSQNGNILPEVSLQSRNVIYPHKSFPLP